MSSLEGTGHHETSSATESVVHGRVGYGQGRASQRRIAQLYRHAIEGLVETAFGGEEDAAYPAGSYKVSLGVEANLSGVLEIASSEAGEGGETCASRVTGAEVCGK